MAVESEPDETALDQRVGEDGSTAHVRIENLTKTFGGGDIVAVDDVSLEIDSSDFVVLLGPSGCGKTTTLRCVAGLEMPDSGTIFIDGTDVTDHKPKDRNLAVVFQEIALFPHKSVRANMSFGLDLSTDLSSEEKRNRIESTAEMLGIEELLDRRPDELSGGQQQRVSLGRAMVMEPDAFLLDEPFSALDANLRDQMRVETKQLQRELETAMIFVTHDQEEAMTLGDKIVIMNEGQIAQVGNPYEIYNEPQSLFVAEFIGSPSTNFFSATLDVSADGVSVNSDHFTTKIESGDAHELEGMDGRDVVVGIRPEHLSVDTTNALFDADISVIEPLGDRDAVHLTVADTDIDITAVTAQGEVQPAQETVPVSFDESEIWIFDPEGERLH